MRKSVKHSELKTQTSAIFEKRPPYKITGMYELIDAIVRDYSPFLYRSDTRVAAVAGGAWELQLRATMLLLKSYIEEIGADIRRRLADYAVRVQVSARRVGPVITIRGEWAWATA